MSTELQTTLRERVAAALEENRRQDAEAERVRFKQDCKTLERELRALLATEEQFGFTKQGRRAVVEIEGMRFSFEGPDYEAILVLLKECPHCHADQDFRVYTYSLASLGSALEAEMPWPHKDAKCVDQKDAAAPTAETRLIDALRDYINEHIPSNG